jgi:hypothetical protein
MTPQIHFIEDRPGLASALGRLRATLDVWFRDAPVRLTYDPAAPPLRCVITTALPLYVQRQALVGLQVDWAASAGRHADRVTFALEAPKEPPHGQ